jgi:hypothetical protein
MKVTVKDLAGRAAVLAGVAGLGGEITSPQVSAPELSSLTSWLGITSSVVHLKPGQLAYLATLQAGERLRVMRALLRRSPPALWDRGAFRELINKAEAAKVLVFRSRSLPRLARTLSTTDARISLHGVLRIFGLGTLIVGESAIGRARRPSIWFFAVMAYSRRRGGPRKTGGGITGSPTDMGADLLQIRARHHQHPGLTASRRPQAMHGWPRGGTRRVKRTTLQPCRASRTPL